MKYIIYGAGYRGKRLLNYIKEDEIVAFVDSNEELYGKTIEGIPIISLEDYMANYISCYMLVTPAFCEELNNMLENKGIFQYSTLFEMPTEFSGYGSANLKEIVTEIIKGKENIVIYGMSAFGFMVYDWLKETHNIKMICDNAEKGKWIKKYHNNIELIESLQVDTDAVVVKTIRNENFAIDSCEIINLFECGLLWDGYINDNIKKRLCYIRRNNRCFIVATGPSLKREDLDILKINQEFCFGVNKIFLSDVEWRPDVYVCVDSNLINNSVDLIQNYECNLKVIGDSGEKYWEKERFDSEKIHVVAGDSFDAKPLFSKDISHMVYGNGNVVYVCIQLAVEMGFSEIYLLGVDCNYKKGSSNNHFYKEDCPDNLDHNVKIMFEGYKVAKTEADKKNIKIFNATRGGMLEEFERVDFDELF